MLPKLPLIALCAAFALLLAAPSVRAAAPAPPDSRMMKPDLVAQLSRPQPPADLVEVGREAELFRPAPEMTEWIFATFLAEDGPLVNYDHMHLCSASIDVLWTTAEYVKDMVPIAATAEVPNVKGRRWAKARERAQLMEWFGRIPDFLLTFDAVYAAETSDLAWCARTEHELYHCAQKVDQYGAPKFDLDGLPQWGIRGHDVEEHVGVAERYGAVGRNVQRLVDAVNRGPLIAPAQVELACGSCGRRFSA